tara:strand:- start:262 stop:546 length:285 start_codon:yes stop_codon:yes gene_type:complete
MNVWIVVLMIFFAGNSGRVDIKTLPEFHFESAMQCFEFKNSDEFEGKLASDYRDFKPPVKYIRTHCKPYKGDLETYVMNNGSVGICGQASCIWK